MVYNYIICKFHSRVFIIPLYISLTYLSLYMRLWFIYLTYCSLGCEESTTEDFSETGFDKANKKKNKRKLCYPTGSYKGCSGPQCSPEPLLAWACKQKIHNFGWHTSARNNS